MLGIDTISMFDTSSSPLFVVCSSVSCPQYDLSRLSHLKSGGGKLQRRQDLPEEAFYLPADDEVAKVHALDLKKYFFIALSLQVAFPGYTVGSSKVAFQLLSNLFLHPPDSRYLRVATSLLPTFMLISLF